MTQNDEARIERLEQLVEMLLARSPSTFAAGTLLAVPNDNALKNIVSIPVNRAVPYLIRALYEVRDPTTAHSMWTEIRAAVNGDPVTPVLVSAAAEFSVTQPGYANPPTIGNPAFVGSSIVFQLQNPLAANPIDVTVYIVDYRIGPT